MAKKIVIEGLNLLTSISQPWGGVNDTQSAITVHGTSVPPGYEWGINRGEIERFIKEQYGTKFGDLRTTDPDEQNFIHILCFATKADAEAWDEDPTTAAGLIIKDLTIPISTASVDSYVATLSTNRSTSVVYLTKDGDDFPVQLRLNATHIIAATSTQEPMSGNGTLIMERSANGVDYTQVYQSAIAASSEQSGYPFTLNTAGLLTDGALNYIRLRAIFPYTNNEGESRVMASTPIVLQVNSVSLTVDMTTPWHEPQVDPSALSLAYNIRGNINRVLHLRVTGSVGTYETSQNVTPSQTQATFSLVEMAAYGLLTHGIKTCEAWLTAGDETSGELESEHLVNRIMVVRTSAGEEVYMQPKLLISEMKSEVENFVQTRLLAYAIYSPSKNDDGDVVNNGPAIPVTFALTNSANSIISSQQTRYASVLVTPNPGFRYYLDLTVEIEQDGETLASFLHATREVDGTVHDFLLESIGSGSIYLRVDNTGGFQPTAGSTFLLNPKQRNNEEANPMTILNAKANNAVIESEWYNFRLGNEDGYIKDENGESCLRVPAGRKLFIRYNPLALLYRSPNASLTMEFDVCMRNVTNEADAILKLAELISGVWRGLRLLPMTGFFTTESWNAGEESDFRWQEDVRQHIVVNIVNAVYPNAHNDALVTAEKAEQGRGSMSLVRIFINGVIQRELVYTPSSTEFCTGAMSNGGFEIGQDGADIDIYGMRFFEGVSLDSVNVQQDWYSTIPDSDKKRRLKAENNIIDPNTGLIGLDYISGNGSVPGIKRNWLIWHGNEPYHDNAHKNETGWIQWARYDNAGNYLPELSGSFCRETKSVPQKSQGTTAKTYYYHNIQWDGNKATGIITIDVSMLHSSITAEWDAEYEWLDGDDQPTGEVGAWMIKGGYLGKNFPLPTETALPYHGTPTTVTVPDGWIDGNGKYRGVGIQIAEGIPMAQKTVNKINYASSMQSHLIGINWLYNELHTAICGKNTMQQAVNGAMVAKHTEPFLFFTQADGSNRAVFRGPCAWGAGKMDKPSWGYVKSAHPDFCMIEGADNDKQLTDMRVPWDDIAHGNSPAKVFYDPDEEAFYYRIAGGDAEKCLDFDAGKTDNAGYPTSAIVGYIKAAWNFLYLHAPRIRHYDGTLAEFMTDADWAQRPITSETTEEERERIEQARSRVNTANKYWCHSEGGSAAGDYLLKRYDFADGEWVDAGLWNGTQYAQIDLRTYDMTAAAWNALTEAERNQSAIVNKAFVDAIVADCRTNIGNYFKVSSLKFHYCFQNHFIAGTDNCSKNTYYVLDPVTHLFELHQDDVDTTLATDNSGLQSKPYYIDRMHPYGGANANRIAMTGDVDNANILYEGYYNVLFDLVELMYEPTGELQAMMRTIFSEMASLTGGLDNPETTAMGGVWKALNRYLFNIQRDFPAIVYNEAARIRYEFPELIGFLSDIRAIHPIKQSLGDQLQAELQFMKRRLVYMASYAAFGEFTPTGLRSGLTGLSEATDSFGMQKFALPGSSSPSPYVFRLVPHQWIYPTGGRETNNLIDPHERVAPGDTFVLDINPGQASDLGINVFGLNYYRELGNVGDMVANNGQANFTLNGRRLTKFEAVPTVFYTEAQLPAFRVNNIIIGSATRLREFNVEGAVIGTGTLNLSALTLAETINTKNTKISQIRLPETSTLATLRLPDTLTQLSLTGQPGMDTLEVQGVEVMTRLTMTGVPLLMGVRSMVLCDAMRSADTRREAVTTLVRLANVDWTEVQANLVRWLIMVGDEHTCDITGSIVMSSGIGVGTLVYDEVAKLITRYGDIRSTDNALYVSYPVTNITADSLSIGGKKYVVNSDIETDDEGNRWWKQLGLSVSSGNNVAVITTQDGRVLPDVTWEFVEPDADTFAEFPDEFSPWIIINSLAARQLRTVRVTLRTTTGVDVTCDKKIGFWNRIPEVGDFAWTDGTFDNEDDQSKKWAGIVVMREVLERDEEDNITAVKLWVEGTHNISLPASYVGRGSANVPSYNGEGYTTSWGIYPGASYGFSDATGASADPLIAHIRTELGVSDPFETPLPNKSTDFAISPSTYQDEANAQPVTGAMATSTSYSQVGDGTGYKQRTESEAGMDFATEYENETLLAYANRILKAVYTYFPSIHSQIEALGMRVGVDIDAEDIPLTRQAAADIMMLIIEAADAAAGGSLTGPARYRELMFIAVRVCSLWSPAEVASNAITEEELHEQYRRGHWMLPANGLLARIFNFLWNSSCTTNPDTGVKTRANGAQATINNSNEQSGVFIAHEAQLPLFSNVLYRSNSRRNINLSAGSSHWSVTETYRLNARYVNFYGGHTDTYYKYSSNVVRPVAAFIFRA